MQYKLPFTFILVSFKISKDHFFIEKKGINALNNYPKQQNIFPLMFLNFLLSGVTMRGTYNLCDMVNVDHGIKISVHYSNVISVVIS
jgi:hypothetical protein